MPRAKKSTESKSKDPVLERIAKEANELEERERGLQRKAQRRDNIFCGVFTAFYLVMAVVAIVSGNWGTLLFVLAMWLWIPMIYLNNKVINGQRYIIHMMTGLRDIENKALMQRIEEEGK